MEALNIRQCFSQNAGNVARVLFGKTHGQMNFSSGSMALS
jgi:hypothetical protein